MGGFFGVAAKSNCVADVFYGTDYHSHLGTKRGGLAVVGDNGFVRVIHNIENAQFRSKFDPDLERLGGRSGIGVISDTDDQPLLIRSHLGDYAIATVGVVANAEALAREAFRHRRIHLSEMGSGDINPTEVVASLINMEDSFEAGIRRALAEVDFEGSCSLLVLTRDGIYAARDRRGRTPVIIGRKEGATAVTFETCAFPNLDYQTVKVLGPGEIVFITADGWESRKAPEKRLQICSFLWVYYGYPASTYEGINVEDVRNRCGAALARRFPGRRRLRGRHPRFGHRPRPGFRHRGRPALQAPLRQVLPHLGPQLHAPAPGGPRPGGAHETDPHPRADRRQTLPVLRGLDRARHAAPRHHQAAV